MIGINTEKLDERQRKLAVSLFEVDCLLFGSFKLSSGITISAFLDLIAVFSHPKIMVSNAYFFFTLSCFIFSFLNFAIKMTSCRMNFARSHLL